MRQMSSFKILLGFPFFFLLVFGLVLGFWFFWFFSFKYFFPWIFSLGVELKQASSLWEVDFCLPFFFFSVGP